ncbi:MAG: hypothetical protein KIT58_21220 [Planctomycetota bacterium]|nr:hypothetical protein [Planctomycetota bacterium]
MLVRRFVGDRRSMEIRSVDGRVWSVVLCDRGRLVKVPRATTEQVERLVVERRLQPTDRLLLSPRVTSV